VKVFANFPHEAPPEPEYRVVTVGVFDGVHRGHQRILKRTIEVADGMPVALVTFDPHPRAVLGPPKRARLLSPLRERLQLLGTWPLAAVVVLRFDQAIAQLSYREFVRQALVERLGARRLVLGYNVAFGHERQGNRDSLAALGAEIGYAVDFIEAVEHEGEPVSSTRIRHCLDGGDVAGAAALLGRAYELEGTVVRGTGRGRVLGIPTANLELHPEKLVPANGVYAVRVRVGLTHHLGALNVGVVPTFAGSGERCVEVHLLDYTGDLYGARLRVELVARLRAEKRFSGGEALVAQVRKDCDAVRVLLAPRPDRTND
jgi:riboflavin kinase/FMN adenylyltransferase